MKLYRQYGEDEFSAKVIGYHGITDNQVIIDLLITKPDGQPATCAVRARDRSGAVVGRATISVPAGGKNVEMSYTLVTTGLPVGGESLGCDPQR